jgi:F-type H+-transporting ATPase subunit alpha
MDTIRETGDLSDDTVTALKDAVGEFRRGFETSSGELLVRDEPVEPVDEAEIEHEHVTRSVTRAKK